MQYTLVADGRSDKVLVHVINWTLDQRDITYTPQVPDWLDQKDLRGRCREALLKYPCDILFVHRDAEKEDSEDRRNEILEAVRGIETACVLVVPVRMTEAWLLSNEKAIRIAAENPRGTMHLDMPTWKRWERLPDPKDVLEDLLKTATDLPLRRLRRFSVERARYRVAEVTTDFAPLRQLTAFKTFETEIDAALENVA